MKLYKFDRPKVVRVDIFIKGECKTFTVDERDAVKVSENLKKILSKELVTVKINPIMPPTLKVTVQCYEHDGKVKGKYKSFRVYGLTVNEAHEMFMKNFE